MRQGQIIKKFRSKKGKDVTLRIPKITDANELMKMINSVIDERDYILRIDRIKYKEEAEWLQNVLGKIKNGLMIMLVAVVNGKVIGNVEAKKGIGVRSHVAGLGITIVNGFREEGIGSVMMNEIISMTKKYLNTKIVTLEVYETNKRAEGLYGKLGFKTVGIIPRAIKRRNRYISEKIMYKEL